MSVGEIVAIVIASMTGLGLIGTWIKNGRQDVKQRTQLEANLKNEIKEVKDDIKSPEYGLSAIKKKVDDQALYCARTSTNLMTRVQTLEKERGGRNG